MQKSSTWRLTATSLLTALIIIMAFTPLGFIPLPFVKATITHIPVIIGAILLGPASGALLGGIFGAVSMIHTTMVPSVSSFAFSPFIPLPGQTTGSWKALLVAIVPRILMGLIVGLLYRALSRTKLPVGVGLAICGFVGSMSNTVLVLGALYLFFGPAYAASISVSYELLLGVLLGIVASNGIFEAIVAILITTVVCKALFRYSPSIAKR